MIKKAFYYLWNIYPHILKSKNMVSKILTNTYKQNFLSSSRSFEMLSKWKRYFSMTFCCTRGGVKNTHTSYNRQQMSSHIFVRKMRKSWSHFSQHKKLGHASRFPSMKCITWKIFLPQTSQSCLWISIKQLLPKTTSRWNYLLFYLVLIVYKQQPQNLPATW